jgi:histidyl-tRNA synthetase
MSAGELPVPREFVDLYVARAGRDLAGGKTAFDLVNDARRAGLSAQLELAGRSLKGQLKHADRIGARYVAIVENGATASLKDMQSGEQRETDVQSVIPSILRSHRL